MKDWLGTGNSHKPVEKGHRGRGMTDLFPDSSVLLAVYFCSQNYSRNLARRKGKWVGNLQGWLRNDKPHWQESWEGESPCLLGGRMGGESATLPSIQRDRPGFRLPDTYTEMRKIPTQQEIHHKRIRSLRWCALVASHDPFLCLRSPQHPLDSRFLGE